MSFPPLLFMLMVVSILTSTAEDNKLIQGIGVTSCSAEINSPTLQQSFNAVLNKSIANCDSIEKVIVRFY